MRPVGDIEIDDSGDAMRLIATLVAWIDRQNLPRSRAKNIVAIIREQGLSERNSKGTGNYTARAPSTARQGRSVVPDINEAEPTDDVIEASRIVEHLEYIDPRLAYAVIAWARHASVSDMAKNLHCARSGVGAYLKAAVAVCTSCVVLGVFSLDKRSEETTT